MQSCTGITVRKVGLAREQIWEQVVVLVPVSLADHFWILQRKKYKNYENRSTYVDGIVKSKSVLLFSDTG